jgi:hypothetical protein
MDDSIVGSRRLGTVNGALLGSVSPAIVIGRTDLCSSHGRIVRERRVG